MLVLRENINKIVSALKSTSLQTAMWVVHTQYLLHPGSQENPPGSLEKCLCPGPSPRDSDWLGLGWDLDIVLFFKAPDDSISQHGWAPLSPWCSAWVHRTTWRTRSAGPHTQSFWFSRSGRVGELYFYKFQEVMMTLVLLTTVWEPVVKHSWLRVLNLPAY